MTTKSIIDQLVFDFSSDVEGDNNRGWQVDQITAFYNGEEVGYLKLAYIPKQRFAEYYPTIFNWMDQIRGNCIIPRAKVDESGDDVDYKAFRDSAKRHYNTFTTEELRTFANRVNMVLRGGDISRDLESCDRDAILDFVKKLEVKANEINKTEFKNFKTYYVNKPIDDFIRVEKDFQRKGIAEHLYKLGAKWMESCDLPFYLSTCRQPAAEALSAKMRTNGNLKKMSNRREKFLPETMEL